MLKAMREEADADRIADREFMKQKMAKMESWGEKIRQKRKPFEQKRKPFKQKRKPCETRGWKPK
jgi:hypothetical protein